jgi:uncharacterized repeat protein (TIGR01451 family)
MRRLLALCAAAVGIWPLASATPAVAADSVPGFTIASFASPTNFSANDSTSCLLGIETCDRYTITVTNASVMPAPPGLEKPVTITDSLPAGLTVQKISLFVTRENTKDFGTFFCTTVPVRCVFPLGLEPDEQLRMVVYVTIEPSAVGPLTNRATVSGSGAATVATPEGSADINPVSPQLPAFGPSEFNFYISKTDGTPDRQAGDHPYELTTTIGLRSMLRPLPENQLVRPDTPEDVRDVLVDLPFGFVGSTLATPECTLTQLSSEQRCPANTQVGEIETEPATAASVASPIWNLVPDNGAPAEFGYIDALKNAHIFYARVVPSARGYVLQTQALQIPQVSLAHISVTFFGDPTAKQEELAKRAGKESVPSPHIPFFTNPTNCSSEEPTATIYMDSWQHPAQFNPDGTPVNLEEPAWAKAEAKAAPTIGCNALQFQPTIAAQPTTHQADAPSGLNFELKLPQPETVSVPATPTLKKAVVTFPEGFTVDPSAGDGLEACSEGQIGWRGGSPLNFTAAQPQCPEASKIGTLELETPLVGNKLEGEIFLANQNENPFGATLAAYLVVHDPTTGVLIKIAGKIEANPSTGQLTTVFDESPNLPFSDLKLHLFAGPRGVFATPEGCGSFAVNTQLFPYSYPDSGEAPATPSDHFDISEGCSRGFSPSFTGGSLNLLAGAYTPFVVSFGRSDSDQELAALSVGVPPGVLAKITGVPLCADAEANSGNCPEASRVGSVTAGSGPGPNPLFVAGKVYLTGPYKGAPYGLSVVVPAIAGPFNFGDVVVRQALYIDPNDAHVTDVSDPFPTILHVQDVENPARTIGVPIRLRRVDLRIDRPAFVLNPTSCSRLALRANVISSQAAEAAVSAPFQVDRCDKLGFSPKLHISVTGKTSRVNGAGMTAILSYPSAPQGSQVNIASVKVTLPKQLPSRLTTLQRACLAATFEANPARCPSASVVGHAAVTTPLLPLPLNGPAYLVSHGGEAFPSLTIVLQGNGVTVELVGATLIRKGITSTNFKSTPDVPFTTFTLTLPAGPFSVLAANGNLCKAKLVMPTIFRAQNGAEIHQSTPIATIGCPRKHVRTTKHGRIKRGGLKQADPPAHRVVPSEPAASHAKRKQTVPIT